MTEKNDPIYKIVTVSPLQDSNAIIAREQLILTNEPPTGIEPKTKINNNGAALTKVRVDGRIMVTRVDFA